MSNIHVEPLRLMDGDRDTGFNGPATGEPVRSADVMPGVMGVARVEPIFGEPTEKKEQI